VRVEPFFYGAGHQAAHVMAPGAAHLHELDRPVGVGAHDHEKVLIAEIAIPARARSRRPLRGHPHHLATHGLPLHQVLAKHGVLGLEIEGSLGLIRRGHGVDLCQCIL